MPADQIKKTKVLERNFECQIMDKKNAIRSESVLNQNTVKVYTDGSQLHGEVGAGFYAKYPNNSPKQAFFHLGIHSTVFQAKDLAIPEVVKNLLLEKMHNQSIVVLVNSQAAIKSNHYQAAIKSNHYQAAIKSIQIKIRLQLNQITLLLFIIICCIVYPIGVVPINLNYQNYRNFKTKLKKLLAAANVWTMLHHFTRN